MKFLVLFAFIACATAAPTDAPPDDQHLPGGLHKIEVTDTRLVTILAQAQKDLNSQMNSINYYRVGKVIDASTQVVAGVMYHVSFEFGSTKCVKSQMTATTNVAECTGFEQVQICKVRVLSQAWTNTLETEHFECQAKPVTTDPHELPGGKHKLDVNDASLLTVMTEAETKINQHFNGGHQYQRVTKVIEAESQVVNGVAYHVTFELSETQCQKTAITKETNIKTECNQLSHPQTCKAVIISQPWLKSTEVSQIDCQTKPQATGVFFADTPVMAGGHHQMDVNDAELLKTLTEVTPQLNDKTESTYYSRVGKVLSAESQVVSGVMYHVSIELGQTECLKTKITKETNILTECATFTRLYLCHIKIWSQPWLKHTEVTEMHCD